MYTTIQDPNNPVYMSNSETYAQIHPLVFNALAEVNPIPSCSGTGIQPEEVPQPPSVDSLKNVAHSHSRQG